MTRREYPFFGVRLEAEKLLKELGINEAPINPFEIARRLDIELRPLPDNEGWSVRDVAPHRRAVRYWLSNPYGQ